MALKDLIEKFFFDENDFNEFLLEFKKLDPLDAKRLVVKINRIAEEIKIDYKKTIPPHLREVVDLVEELGVYDFGIVSLKINSRLSGENPNYKETIPSNLRGIVDFIKEHGFCGFGIANSKITKKITDEKTDIHNSSLVYSKEAMRLLEIIDSESYEVVNQIRLIVDNYRSILDIDEELGNSYDKILFKRKNGLGDSFTYELSKHN